MDETLRLRALQELAVLDTEAEERFDRIARFATAHFDVPIALISLVDSERQWFKAVIGLDERETSRDIAFCDHTIRLGPRQTMVVEDATLDPRFCANPLVTGAPHIRFYAGATLTTLEGANIGTLCLIDDRPRPSPSSRDLVHLQSLADIVVDQFELSRARKDLDDRHRMLDLSEQMSLVGYWTLDVLTGAVFWSPQVYAIHGVDPGAFRPGLDDALAFYVAKDRDMIRQLIADRTASGTGWNFDATLERRDGSLRSVKSVAECQKDTSGNVIGFFGVFKDLTDERRALAQAVEQERRYRLLADHASDVIAVYDIQGTFSYLSPSISEMLGFTSEELIGRTPFDFILPEDHERVRREFLEGADGQGPMTVEYRATTKDGRIRWLEARPRYRRDNAGRIVEITDSVRDITDRKEREFALAEARAAAEGASRAKAGFLAHMSHELRTPMNGVVGFTDLLSGTSLDPEQRRFVDMIADSSRSMLHLLNDILDMSKIDAGQMQLVPEVIDLRHKLRDVVRLMEPAAAAKNIGLTLMVDDCLPASILIDQLRLRQIVINLTGNAVKFTQAGRVVISAAMAGDDDAPRLRIEVQDSGIGIAPDRLSSILQPFVQADDRISRRFGGTGLGLSITNQLVDLMEGTLTVRSVEHEGSTFIVDLPLRVPDARNDNKDTDESMAPVAFAGPAADDVRVLVAEDHDINRVMMESLGKQLAIPFEIARDGQEVLDMVEQAAREGRPYDLILMDMQMPNMDGLEATQMLRSRGHDAGKLPIVALTANAFPEDIAACFDAGMQHHLSKPLRKSDLAQVISRFAARRDERERTWCTSCDEDEPGMHERLHARYVERRDASLAKLAELAQAQSRDEITQAQVIVMLHKLGGVAATFGEPQLGEAALDIEHRLRSASHDEGPAIARGGIDQIRLSAAGR